MNEFWQGLSRRARISLVAGVLSILSVFSVIAWWSLRTQYQVLFNDLKPQDAQAMVAELERQKIAYRLGSAGTSILVDADAVHATRLKLMGKDMPLHGAVGFELFNNTDFGMTEFAQKINFQRALQGELTRTIMALAEIEEARVHLALPEQGLFRQSASTPKASISLTVRAGQTLRPEQVVGIQRLVAAAVPGMQLQDVTMVDNRGIALTRVGSETASSDAGMRLDFKRDMENYLSRKATSVLDRLFGAGLALASVDLVLNMDQIRVTTEDVLPAPATNGAAGVMVKQKETVRDQVAPLDAGQDRGRGGGGSLREAEYAVGRRVEQLISQPGTVRKLQVVAVVRQSLSAEQEEQIRKLVGAAVGALPERGDTVVVQTLGAFQAPGDHSDSAGLPIDPSMRADVLGAPAASTSQGEWWSLVSAFLGGAVLVGAVALAYRTKRRDMHGTPSLGPDDRSAALQAVRQWMAQDDSRDSSMPVSDRPRTAS